MQKKVYVYTDGACDNMITKRGSWAYVAVDENDNIICEKKSDIQSFTTNNRMEYLAFINCVYDLVTDYDEIHVYSDSELLVMTYNQWMHKWTPKKRSSRANLDLVTQLENIHKSYGDSVKLSWIKGHAGHKWNEYVDKLAQKGIPMQRQYAGRFRKELFA